MKLLAIALTLLIIRCGTPDPEPQPNPDSSLCGQAGERIKELECKDQAGNPMWVNKSGEPFATTCERVQNEGLISMNPRCIIDAETCKEIKECPKQSKK